MCGAYDNHEKDDNKFYDRFGVQTKLDNYKPHWNIHPGSMNPVILMQEHIEIKYMVWTFIPHWSKERRLKYSTINARSDRVMESSVYKDSFLKRRALIPATGFFEPDKVHYHKPPYPWHYFTLKDEPIFALAGLYDIWKDPQTGKEVYTYTIMTTEPNEIVGEIHPRMPVILRKEDEKKWIDPDIIEPEHILPMIQKYPSAKMEGWRVADEAKRPGNDNPGVIEPYQANQPSLLN